MSKCYSTSTIVGFQFTQDELRVKFGTKVKAKTHMEPRFDEKTFIFFETIIDIKLKRTIRQGSE